MISQSEEQFVQSETFHRQIKNTRFYCQLNNDKMKCQLLDIVSASYYEVEYGIDSIPQQFTKYVKDIEELYIFITAKTKIFKILAPGKIMCCQYMGRVQKFITISMNKVQTSQTVRQDPLFFILKRCCQELFAKVNSLKTEIKIKDKEILLFTKPVKNQYQLCQKQTRRRKYQSDSLKKEQKKKQTSIKIKRFQSNGIKKINPKIWKKQQIPTEESKFAEQIMVLNNNISKSQKNTDYFLKNQSEICKDEAHTAKKHKVQQKLCLNIAKKSPFFQKFRIAGNQIEKINNSQPFELHSNTSIGEKGQIYFSIYISKTKYRSISIGILGQRYYDQPTKILQRNFCICYDGYYGIILNQSIEAQSNLKKLNEGDIIKTIVDLDQKFIEWNINSQSIAKVPISSQLLTYELYPYIELQDKGDIVILNRQEQNNK